MRYVGLDLTDPYARAPRAVDVAVLDPDTLQVTFPPAIPWRAGGPGAMAAEITRRFSPHSHAVILDAPQGLAAHGRSARACERACTAPGRTGDTLPRAGGRPFAGYIRGSVELWSALLAAGPWSLPAGHIGSGHLLEAYPGDTWRRLAGSHRLDSKAKQSGRRQRVDLLGGLGFRLATDQPTHDQLDAAICAVLGLWASTQPGRVEFLGEPARHHGAVLREGQMVRPRHPAPSAPVSPSPPRLPAPSPAVAWCYRTTPAGTDRQSTFDLIRDEEVLWRPARNKAGHAIANVRHLRPGQRIVIHYTGADEALIGTLAAVDGSEPHLAPVDDFPACVAAVAPGSDLHRRLEAAGYSPPQGAVHTVLLLTDVEAAPEGIRLPPAKGQNAIRRWELQAEDGGA